MAGQIGRSDQQPPHRPTARGWSHLTAESLATLLLLNDIPFFGPQKFRKAYGVGLSPQDLVDEPTRVASLGGNRGPAFISHLAGAIQQRSTFDRRAASLLEKAERLGAAVLSYGDASYPPVLLRSNYPVPILFVRGSAEVLSGPDTVACVGSRNIRAPYTALHERFARTASVGGSVVVSGFALGADSIGHRAAMEAGGKTIGVMAGGVDRPFPPENRELWDRLLKSDSAAFVSEAPFGAIARSLTLRRRNKLIVALSLGVLVSQSAADGGAMNAYRFGLEDHKPVATFADDGRNDTSGNRLIALRAQSGDRAFSLQPTDEEFQEWLRGLASLT